MNPLAERTKSANAEVLPCSALSKTYVQRMLIYKIIGAIIDLL